MCSQRVKLASLRAETVEHRLPNGNALALEVTLSPYYGRSGQVEGAVCVLSAAKESCES
jgi:hypothetical protein